MSKKKILLIAVALVIVVVGIIAAVISQKEKEMDPEELLERFEKAAEEVLGECSCTVKYHKKIMSN